MKFYKMAVVQKKNQKQIQLKKYIYYIMGHIHNL